MADVEELRRDLIVIGASAGGVEALRKIVALLPDDLPAAILVVLHIWPEGPSLLPQILNSAGPLTAVHPYDGEALEYGRIYVAPPDFHLMVEPGMVRVMRGPKENRHRPAVDPLFRSVAAAYGPRVVACVLSGSMDDGTAGALAVKRHGGMVIVQDPAGAIHKGMPESTIENVVVDCVLPLDAIAPKLIELSMNGTRPAAGRAFRPSDPDQKEVKLLEADMDAIEDMNRRGRPSVYACPDCNGILWELDDNGLLRFRCRTGHAYTAASLAAEQSDQLEQALWTAFRALEEVASLHRRMAERARERRHLSLAAEHEAGAQNEEDSARVLRDLILKPRPTIEMGQVDEVES
jgi:two-component system chemotaxis response regulator CheB